PRSETPCDLGFAVRLAERRKRANPGTWRSMSSTVKAGVEATSFSERNTVLPGASERRSCVRLAETITCSLAAEGLRTMSSGPLVELQLICAVVNPGAEAAMVPALAATLSNVNLPLSSVFTLTVNVPLWNVTSACCTAAPEASWTVPTMLVVPASKCVGNSADSKITCKIRLPGLICSRIRRTPSRNHSKACLETLSVRGGVQCFLRKEDESWPWASAQTLRNSFK